MSDYHRVGAVLIGRNEGARLVSALAALPVGLGRSIYVDSGSTDGSIQVVNEAGIQSVSLDMARPFTAARARNLGVSELKRTGAAPEFVQFIDGDCILDPGWIGAALDTMESNPRLGVVCGRRRERFPEASIYNRMIDREWDRPVGKALSCGGDALVRLSAFDEVGGFCDDMIAGEEPELCVRLRKAGWHIERIDAEMTLHDADLTRFSQWWKRSRRAGYAAADGAWRHGAPPECHKVAETRRVILWGLALPALILLGLAVLGMTALLAAAIWPLQMLRLRFRGHGWTDALFIVLGKFPEAIGLIDFHFSRLSGSAKELIEYK